MAAGNRTLHHASALICQLIQRRKFERRLTEDRVGTVIRGPSERVRHRPVSLAWRHRTSISLSVWPTQRYAGFAGGGEA